MLVGVSSAWAETTGWLKLESTIQPANNIWIGDRGEGQKPPLEISWDKGILDITVNGPRTKAAEAFLHDFLHHYWWDIVCGVEIKAILREAQEFIEDRDKGLWPTYSMELSVYRTPPTAIDLQNQAIQEAQSQLDRLKRETALRKRIDKLLEQLTEGGELLSKVLVNNLTTGSIVIITKADPDTTPKAGDIIGIVTSNGESIITIKLKKGE